MHWSFAPLVPWSIGPLVHWTIGLLDHFTIGPLFECQISKVNKVKLLLERTSGVPPIIFMINDLRIFSNCDGDSDDIKMVSMVMKHDNGHQL